MESKFLEKESHPIDELNFRQYPEAKLDAFMNSQLKQRYLQYFGQQLIKECEQFLEKEDLVLRFQKYDIRYDSQAQQTYKIQLELLQQTINSQSMMIQTRWGKFSTIIYIHNVAKDSITHTGFCKNGASGSVYLAHFGKEEFAVKCMYLGKLNSQLTILMAIREYFLMKIAAALGIGPHLQRFMGFDMIIYQNCIEFAMEICSEVDEDQIQLEKASIMVNLLILHRFGIVHFDIKPANIMHSKHFGKIVFIDYGLSSISECQIGERVEICFRGTLDYCSNQMTQCFLTNHSQLVDIYYNDVYCLISTLRYFVEQKSILQIDEQNQIEEDNQYSDYKVLLHLKIAIFIIKYYMFTKNFKVIKLFLKKYEEYVDDSCFKMILDYMFEFQPSIDLKEFYRQIKNYNKEGIQYMQLSQIYSSQRYIFQTIKQNQVKKAIFSENKAIFNLLGTEQTSKSNRKDQILNILAGQSKQSVSEIGYFKIFMNYISFSNNLYSVNMKKRLEAVQYLYKQHYLIDCCQSHHSILIIHHAIISILQFILNKSLKENQKKISLCRILLWDILQHIFILNALNQSQYISYLQQIYDSWLLDLQYKLEFLIRLKHNSIWLLFRLKSKHNNVHIIYQSVSQWFIDKLYLLKNDKFFKYSWLAENLYKSWVFGLTTHHLDKHIEDASRLPISLRDQLKLDFMTQDFIYSPKSLMPSKIEALLSSTHSLSRTKTMHFSFYLYQAYFNDLNDPSKASEMLFLIHNNLQSQQIFSQLIMKYQLSFKQDSSEQDFLVDFNQFLENIQLNGLILHHSVLLLGLERLKRVHYCSQYHKHLVRLIFLKMQRIAQGISFQYFFQYRFFEELKHICNDFYNYINFINIKYEFHSIFRIKDDFLKNRVDLLAKINKIQCLKCRLITESLCQLYSHRSWLQNRNQGFDIESENNLYESSKRLSSLYENYDEKQSIEYFILMNYQSMMKLCCISKYYELKYRGIHLFYEYLMEIKQLNYYLHSSQSCKVLFLTIKVLTEFATMQELVVFLTSLSAKAMMQGSFSYFHKIFSIFGQFINQNHKDINLINIFNIISNHNYLENGQINTFNAVYYIYFLYYLPRDYVNLCLLKFVSCLQYLPNQIKFYLEGEFYRFLLNSDQQNLKLRYLNMIQHRKRIFLIREIVKIYKRIKLNPIKKNQISKSLVKCQKTSSLKKKACHLGGPYDLKIPDFECIKVQIKKSKSQLISI